MPPIESGVGLLSLGDSSMWSSLRWFDHIQLETVGSWVRGCSSLAWGLGGGVGRPLSSRQSQGAPPVPSCPYQGSRTFYTSPRVSNTGRGSFWSSESWGHQPSGCDSPEPHWSGHPGAGPGSGEGQRPAPHLLTRKVLENLWPCLICRPGESERGFQAEGSPGRFRRTRPGRGDPRPKGRGNTRGFRMH